MPMNFLEFEKPIAELIELREKMTTTAQKSNVDVSKSLLEVDEKLLPNEKRSMLILALGKGCRYRVIQIDLTHSTTSKHLQAIVSLNCMETGL